MNYTDFKDYVVNNIKFYLPEKYENYEVRFMNIRKSASNNYEGLLISPPSTEKGATTTPVINMTMEYQKYIDNEETLETVLKRMAKIRTESYLPQTEDLGKYNPKTIRMRLINTENNRKYIEDKPYREVEDLTILYTYRVIEIEGEIAEAVISNDLAEYWGVTEQELYGAAMGNMTSAPYTLCHIFEYLFGIDEIPENEETSIYILSNRQKTHGACEMLNSVAMKDILTDIGEFYILPSSTEEVIIIPKTVAMSIKELREMVKTVNQEEVNPALQLSENIYEYDFENNTLRIIE